MAAIIACIFKPSDVPQRKRAVAPAPRAPSIPNPLPRIETPRAENQTGPRQHRVPQSSQAYSPTTTAPARSAAPAQRKSSKFWFLKPGALPATVAEGSPYHTIHVASTSRDDDGGGASPKKSDQRSSSAKRRKKKTSASGSIAYSAHQATAPPAPPSTLLLNKARVTGLNRMSLCASSTLSSGSSHLLSGREWGTFSNQGNQLKRALKNVPPAIK